MFNVTNWHYIKFIFVEQSQQNICMYNSKILGMGHYVPENVVTNDDLSQLMDTNDQWIQERTGIRQRRWAVKGDGDTTFSMGLKAAKNAIQNSGIDKQDIDKRSSGRIT